MTTYAERLTKIGLVVADEWTMIIKLKLSCNAISIRMFSAKTTGPIFTKFLHDMVTLVTLLNHAHTRSYPIPFLNDRAISARG